MSEYTEDKSKRLYLENIYLKKKLETIKSIIDRKATGLLKTTLTDIIEDNAKILTTRQINDKKIIDCSLSILITFLSRSEFNSYRAGRYFTVNKSFKELLNKMFKKRYKNGKHNKH